MFPLTSVLLFYNTHYFGAVIRIFIKIPQLSDNNYVVKEMNPELSNKHSSHQMAGRSL